MKDKLVAWCVGPILLLLGSAIFLSPRLDSFPLSEPAVVEASQIDPAPPRKPLRQPLTIQVGGFEKECMDCHALFNSKQKTPFALFQHKETQQTLDHGINTRCSNCHDLKRHDRLVLDSGTTVGFDEAEQVCAKCHGTTYRDWQRGSHGKTMGYWDKSRGKSDRLTCTQCHDPHAPAFDKFHPLPGPHTLRMNSIPRTHDDGHAPKKVNPLRIWSSSNGHATGRSQHPTDTTESKAAKTAEFSTTGQETSDE